MIAVTVAALLLLPPQTDTVEVLSEATVYGESSRQELLHTTLGSV